MNCSNLGGFTETGLQLGERQMMTKSLELAGATQRSLLPEGTVRLKQFHVTVECADCGETGGDYYDFIDVVDLGLGRLPVVFPSFVGGFFPVAATGRHMYSACQELGTTPAGSGAVADRREGVEPVAGDLEDLLEPRDR